MNKLQDAAISRIRKSVNDWCGGRYEIKSWELHDNVHFLSLVAVTGLPNDEGTMASVFARDRAHIFIGPRGGITYPVMRNGHQVEKRFKSFLGVVADQNCSSD